jgi:hypothetical protein
MDAAQSEQPSVELPVHIHGIDLLPMPSQMKHPALDVMGDRRQLKPLNAG